MPHLQVGRSRRCGIGSREMVYTSKWVLHFSAPITGNASSRGNKTFFWTGQSPALSSQHSSPTHTYTHNQNKIKSPFKWKCIIHDNNNDQVASDGRKQSGSEGGACRKDRWQKWCLSWVSWKYHEWVGWRRTSQVYLWTVERQWKEGRETLRSSYIHTGHKSAIVVRLGRNKPTDSWQ